MNLIIEETHEKMSAHAADIIIEIIKAKPNAMICVASGETPLLTCQILTQRIVNEAIDITQTTWIGLDEWIDVLPENSGSCHYFQTKNIFEPLGLLANQCHLFSHEFAKAKQQCLTFDVLIKNHGGLDCILVGVGMNGHIGFNEPGIAFENHCHIVDLDDVTSTVGQKYFDSAMTLSKGVTVGLQHLMEAQTAVLIANGTRKAPIIKRLMAEEISDQLPATIMRKHPNGIILLDAEAGALL